MDARRTRRHRLPLAVAALLAGPAALPAQVVVTMAARTGQANVFAVSNSHLFQTNLASISTTGGFATFGSGDPGLLTDGAFGTSGNLATGAGGSVVAPLAGATVTFHLDVTANPTGYTITGLDSVAGWDNGRDGQEYSVSVSTVSAPTTFTALATVPQFDPGVLDDHSHTRVGLTDGSGVLAAGVAAVRYTFTDFENGATAFREIDAFGSVTPVPEPAGLLVAAGLAAVAGRRLRRTA